MKRALPRLVSERFDLVILGGGIYGLAAAREATLRGLSVAVLEKDDFGQATSSASLKLIHGGLRYLQHLNFARMRVSILERRRMLALAPHLVHPLEFIIPCYGHGLRGPEALRLAFLMNDTLSWDRNRGLDPAHRIPPGRRLSRSECLARLPGLRAEGLTGAGAFCDAQMINSERLTLAFALAADEQGAALANRAEVTGFDLEPGRIRAVRALDRESGRAFSVEGRFFLNMTGPWVDRTAGWLRGRDPDRTVLRSKGIQLVTRSLGDTAFPIESRQKDETARIRRGGRNYFVTPWRGHSLVGTTDTLYRGDPSDFAITETDVSGFLAELQELYPAGRLERGDVRFWIGGLRPLGDEDDRPDVAKASHHLQCIDHKSRDGVDNLLSVTGVKYTVAAHVAETTVSDIVRRTGRGKPAGVGRRTPLPGGAIPDWEAFLLDTTRSAGFPAETARHLAFQYGAAWPRIAALARSLPGGEARITGSREVIRAEVVHAVREEMALHLTDVLLRRTDLGSLGDPGDSAIRECADIMAGELGWTAERTARELDGARAAYRLAP
jgi:glycerol-3-phosphate dehydrogenase